MDSFISTQRWHFTASRGPVVRRAARLLTKAIAAGALLVACDKRQPTVPTAPSARLVLDVAAPPDGYIFTCPPRPFLVSRQVDAGTAEDINGNRVVCDEHLDGADTSATGTLDDILLPADIPIPSALNPTSP